MANDDLTRNLQEQVAEFILSTEVCRRFEIDRSTLTRWIQLGRIKPAGKMPGPSGAYLWDPAYIDALVAAGGPPPAHNPFTSGTGLPPNTGIPYDARDVS
jgi:hypothetical protein